MRKIETNALFVVKFFQIITGLSLFPLSHLSVNVFCIWENRVNAHSKCHAKIYERVLEEELDGKMTIKQMIERQVRAPFGKREKFLKMFFVVFCVL